MTDNHLIVLQPCLATTQCQSWAGISQPAVTLNEILYSSISANTARYLISCWVVWYLEQVGSLAADAEWHPLLSWRHWVSVSHRESCRKRETESHSYLSDTGGRCHLGDQRLSPRQHIKTRHLCMYVIFAETEICMVCFWLEEINSTHT